MQLGVFIPIGNNGWLISTTSPRSKPSFDLNKTIVEKAEAFGFDFALSMIKLHGFGGPSGFWDYNLKSFTLMAGLAATTPRIKLFATCAVLTMPPPIAARMAVTIDSISHGRFGVNIISGWQRREYTQMGMWPGPTLQASLRLLRRIRHGHEGVVGAGRSDFKGDFFQMDDCRCLPMPIGENPHHLRRASDAGTRYAAQYADYNFCASFGYNAPTAVAPSVARLVKATEETGRDCGALILTMIIADETDEAANAKWEHYKAGTDLEALAYRDEQARGRSRAPTSTPSPTGDASWAPTSCRPTRACWSAPMPTSRGCWTNWPKCPACAGVMMTFDDFVIGMEQFGTRIMPLMRSRNEVKIAA